MPPHGDGLDDVPSFSTLIPQTPPNTYMDLEFLGYASPHPFENGSSSSPPPESPQINFAAAADAQHLEEEDDDGQPRFDSRKNGVERRLFGELEAPDDKLMEAQDPAPEDDCPSDADTDMAKVNEAVPQPGPLPDAGGGGDTAPSFALLTNIWPDFFMSVVEQDFFQQEEKRELESELREVFTLFDIPEQRYDVHISRRRRWSVVRFTGPDSKGRKPHQAGWKEMSTKGLRAVADLSPEPPGRRQQQQRYVGLKKTLERDDDGNGNKWHAHEYTALLPSHDGSDKLVPAEFSLRVEFKEDEAPPSAAATSMKRKEDEPPPEATAFAKRPKIAPKKSPVWEHMTKVHVQIAATTNRNGTQRKRNPHYKVMYAICHHCDQVFNADSKNGTHNLSNHLDTCNDCKCTH